MGLSREYFGHISLILFTTISLFAAFYSQWLFLEFDVGREMYLAFVRAYHPDLELYRDLVLYFGPLASTFYTDILRLFSANLFTFFSIGLIFSIGIFIGFYLTLASLTSRKIALVLTLVFILQASINLGGGSLFLPYTVSHQAGLLLLILCFYLAIKFSENNVWYFSFVSMIMASGLLFTKHEYIPPLFVVFLFIIYICFNNSRLILINVFGFCFGLFFFSWYSPILSPSDLLVASTEMFQQHNSGILKNILSLYSPSVLTRGVFQFLIIVACFCLAQAVFYLKNRNSKGFYIGFLGILLFVPLFIWPSFIQFDSRFWLGPVLLISTVIFYMYQFFSKKISPSVIHVFLILITFSFYSRQQNATWMLSPFFLILSGVVFNEFKKAGLSRNMFSFSLFLLVLCGSMLPSKLNQEYPLEKVNTLFGTVYLNENKAIVIQKAIDHLNKLPSSELYTGQESAWLNVFSGRYNRIRNQQWWGYMEPGIMQDLEVNSPEFIATVIHGSRDTLYAKMKLVPLFIRKNYHRIATYSSHNTLPQNRIQIRLYEKTE